MVTTPVFSRCSPPLGAMPRCQESGREKALDEVPTTAARIEDAEAAAIRFDGGAQVFSESLFKKALNDCGAR